MQMRYHVGDYVYIRHHFRAGLLRIVALEYGWQGCVERVTACVLETGAGRLPVPVKDVMTRGEAVAERLAKGKIDGCNLGVRARST